MGVDFLEKTDPNYRRGLRTEAAKLGEANLFSKKIGSIKEVSRLSAEPNISLKEGEQVCVKLDRGDLVAIRGNQIVARNKTPPTTIVNDLAQTGGLTFGTVKKFLPLSRSVDLSIDE